MDIQDLQKRFQRFRTAYLDTPIGREHLRWETDEPIEVRSIFENLRGRLETGEDITDDTLRLLLPHLNTKGNKERKARISTWPCVTKDVKSWFEGANWKKAEEWPAVAAWLLDICEAGKREEWDTWRDLSQEPVQKGFACGFITPIVHCLNPKLPVVNSKVVRTYAKVAPVLGLVPEISSALADYPRTAELLSSLVQHLGGLGLHGFDEWDIYCHWNVAKKLGGKEDDPSTNSTKPPTVRLKPTVPPSPTSSDICDELCEAQHDTLHPNRFEAAVSAAFSELGFDCELIGGSGEADVVAHASLGDESFSLVVDAKTSQKGVPRSGINYDPIKGHQEQHEADHAVVVAPAFSTGHTVQHAEKNAVGLLTTDDLMMLVRDGQRWGADLHWLKRTLSQVGTIRPRFDELEAIRSDLAEVARAVLHTFDAHQRGDESSSGLDEEAIFWLLKGAKRKYPKDRISQIIQFFANPMVNILERKETGYVLTLPGAIAHRRLASLGSLLAAGTSFDPNT